MMSRTTPTIPESVDKNAEPRSEEDIAVEEHLLDLALWPAPAWDPYVQDRVVVFEPVHAQPAAPESPFAFECRALRYEVGDLGQTDDCFEALAEMLRFCREVQVADVLLDPRNARQVVVAAGMAWDTPRSDPRDDLRRAGAGDCERCAIMAPEIVRALCERYGVVAHDRVALPALAVYLGLREIIAPTPRRYDGDDGYSRIWGRGSVLLFEPAAPPVHVRRWHGPVPGASTRDGRFVTFRRLLNGHGQIVSGVFYTPLVIDPNRAALITGCLPLRLPPLPPRLADEDYDDEMGSG
jgi:hypothetical protein